jgi:secondary thiamine-phosphate synthase enzyme
MVFGREITVSTKGFSNIVDITEKVTSILSQTEIKNGIVTVFAIGSTASISTIEFEPALSADFKDQLEKFAPKDMQTRHSQTWGDDNGFSHIRATFMGPGITIPLCNGLLTLGTWQQIIVIDHDNRPRSRKIFVQIMGE